MKRTRGKETVGPPAELKRLTGRIQTEGHGKVGQQPSVTNVPRHKHIKNLVQRGNKKQKIVIILSKDESCLNT